MERTSGKRETDTHTRRLEQLRAAVREGRYVVDPDAIASSIILHAMKPQREALLASELGVGLA
jgi:anti-sigma28 factor (negative regulator of flagellin synthesis)